MRQIGIGFGIIRRQWRVAEAPWFWTENIQRQKVQGGRAIDGFPTVLRKVAIAPIQQGVDIAHDHGFFVGADAQPRQRVRVERLLHGDAQLLFVGQNIVQGLQGVVAER